MSGELPEWAAKKGKSTGRRPKYGLRDMKVGEVRSFSKEVHRKQDLASMRRYLYSQGVVLEMKFRARILEDETIQICRIE